MKKLSLTLVVGALLTTTQAFAAGNNNSPPAGAILDLAGGETGTAAQAINHGAPVTVTVQFTAAVSSTDITFAFREDPAFISFGSVALLNLTTGSPTNLLVNGDFSGGTYSVGGNLIPTGWNYDNVFGASASGSIQSCAGFASGFCWFDGAVQAYDAIDQIVGTTIGDIYALSFKYSDNGPYSVFSDLSTNGNVTGTGGNGVNILAYAQAGLPVACEPGTICTTTPTRVPEPLSLSLFGAGIVGAAMLRRRRK